MNSEYLKESVGKYLSKALCEVAIRRPERPVEFLAYQLIALYEKDQKMQKAEKGGDFKEESESDIDLTVSAQLSQMFVRKLSTSTSGTELEDVSPVSASPSISIGLDEALTEEDKPSDKENLLEEESVTSSGDKEPLEGTDIKSFGETEEDLPKKEMEALDDDSVETTSSISLADLYNLPERRLSAVRDNEPITEVEAKEFGTSDPFLARRNTNLFDVNFAPIGDPSNQPKPA